MRVKFSTARSALIGSLCGASLAGLAACDGPPRPEPSAPPPSPEQAYDEETEAREDAYEDSDAADIDETLDEETPLYDQETDEAEPSPVVTMDPIPNPGDGRAEGEADELPVLEPYDARDAAAEPEKPEPAAEGAIADAADPLPSTVAGAGAASRMAPIPNPPERRRARPDDGLMGAPAQAAAPRRASPPASSTPPPRVVSPLAAGPSVRVPIAPAVGRPADSRTAGLRPTPEPATASEEAATPIVRLDRVERDLRRLVQGGARLDAPTRWTPGETREVRLRLPAGVAEQLDQATERTGGGQGARELSATLTGDGFRIDPAGPQSIDPAAPDGALAWRVTPERADPGSLTARVEATVPTRLGERRTLALGEVSDGRGGGGLSMRTLGWILLAVLGGGLLAWLLGRSNGDAAAADGRRRNRLRAEQRRDRAGPLDLSPGEARSDPTPS